MKTFADSIRNFYSHITPPANLPENVEILWPCRSPEVKRVMRVFYDTFYQDNFKRTFLIGINPGRFGAGVTGLGFTDPAHLFKDCQISHTIKASREISSDFIYSVINALNGPEAFFRYYYFTAMSPVGFTRNSKNLNYYDVKGFGEELKPWMAKCMEAQLRAGANCNVAFSIGMGANYKFLKQFNEEYGFFKKIESLPHPRWVMQYRHSQIDRFIGEYIQSLKVPKRF